MKNVLYILGKLTDDDLEWIIQNGEGRSVSPDEVLIQEGVPTEYLYFTFEGQFGVFVDKMDGKQVAELGPGEIIGEMSFVEYFPPIATVRAIDDGYILCVPRDKLTEKLETDPLFAAHFYLAIAVMISDRFRSSSDLKGEEEEDEIHLDMLEDISRAGSRFDRLVKRVKGV